MNLPHHDHASAFLAPHRSLRYILPLLLFATIGTQAQDSPLLKRKLPYELKLEKQNGEMVRGYLKQVTDSTIVYTLAKIYYGAPTAASDITVPCSDIKQIKLRRTGATRRGAAIGAGTGVLVGLLAGSATTEKASQQGFQLFSRGAAIAMAGIFGFVVGGITGGILGATSWRKYKIDSSKEKLLAPQSAVHQKVYGIIVSTASQ